MVTGPDGYGPQVLHRSLVARAQLALGRGTTLGSFLEQAATVRGDRRAVEDADGRTLTFVEAAERVDRLAGGLVAAVAPGDRVVVATANTYDQFLACLAACRAGGIAVPVNPLMRDEEVDHVVKDAGATVVLRDLEEGEPLGRDLAGDPSSTGMLFYTSGTTGKPKGVALTHQGLLGPLAAGALWPRLGRDDEAVVSLPVAHIMGFITLTGLATTGIPVWFLPKFKAEAVLDAIEQRRSSVFVGVPAMYRLLEEAGAAERDLTSVRFWISGADAMPGDLARRFKGYGASATLPVVGPVGEATFVEGYGMVETGGGVATKISPPLLPVGLGDSLGVPLPGYRFRVVGEDGEPVATGQEGELWVKGRSVVEGYWGSPEATADLLTDDGWIRTGDLARRGVLGTAVFAGRKKDVILNGGYTVYAREVEEALEGHPDVVEAGVTGAPDDRRGEVPVAAVRLSEGASVTSDELVEWARERLSDYKAPRRIVVVDELPKTGTQKVKRKELLELFE
jgi:acyl-CoA synthetase (AMP-forming)/AMP-acid ligase II